jgi:hypothetical protein
MSKIKVDMSNVDEPVGAGDYICIVSKIEVKQGDKAPYLKWELKIGTGESKGLKLFTNTSLSPKALFRLRDLLVAMGMKVPKSAFEIDTDKFIRKIVGVTVVMKDYEGRKVPDIKGFWKPEKDENGRYHKPEPESALPDEDEMADTNDEVDDDEVEEVDL